MIENYLDENYLDDLTQSLRLIVITTKLYKKDDTLFTLSDQVMKFMAEVQELKQKKLVNIILTTP